MSRRSVACEQQGLGGGVGLGSGSMMQKSVWAKVVLCVQGQIRASAWLKGLWYLTLDDNQAQVAAEESQIAKPNTPKVKGLSQSAVLPLPAPMAPGSTQAKGDQGIVPRPGTPAGSVGGWGKHQRCVPILQASRALLPHWVTEVNLPLQACEHPPPAQLPLKMCQLLHLHFSTYFLPWYPTGLGDHSVAWLLWSLHQHLANSLILGRCELCVFSSAILAPSTNTL